MDVKKLSEIIKEQVTEKLDHKNLNVEVDFLKGKMCSTENLVDGIWNQLIGQLPAGSSVCMRSNCMKHHAFL